MKTTAIISLFLLTQSFVGQQPCMASSLYEIYGPRGSVTFSSRKPAKGIRYRVLNPKKSRYSKYYTNKTRYRIRASSFDSIISREASRAGLEYALVKAVVHAESSFNPRAVSAKGAQGLMQLMPATARRFGVRNAFSPEQNVRGGVTYLKWLFKKYRGNLTLAIAAYNAGERAVDRAGGVPPYKETINYVKKVKKLFALYQRDGV